MIHDPPLGFIVNVVYETMVRIGVSPPEMKWGETWESIILPEGYTKPTKEEFEAKFQEIIREYSFKELRQERNRRLAEVDWVTLKAYSTGPPVSEEWVTYMQTLRDLPSVTEDPVNPTWPEKPETPTGKTEGIQTPHFVATLMTENSQLRSKVTALERKSTKLELDIIDMKRRIQRVET